MAPRSAGQQRAQGQDVVSEIRQAVAQAGSLAEALDAVKFARMGGWGDQLARRFKGWLKPTQLRKFFARLLELQREVDRAAKDEGGLSEARVKAAMLQAELAYAQGRKLIPKEFRDVISGCLEKLLTQGDAKQVKADVDRLVDFFRAIIAYLKLYE